MSYEWSPALTVSKCVEIVRKTLLPERIEKEECSGSNMEAYRLKKQNWKRYCQVAALWVNDYAIKK